MSGKHAGSSIDEFLREEGILDEAQAQAVREVAAWQLAGAGGDCGAPGDDSVGVARALTHER